MKHSIYNFIVDNGANHILYNTASDNVVVLTQELYQLYTKHVCDVEALENIHPNFYRYLVQAGFLVNEDVDEPERVVSDWNAIRHASRRFRLTVNPTLNCNMCCWYCYEKKGTAVMSLDVIKRIGRLIEAKMKGNEGYEEMLISFFGGEPLLCYRHEIKKLIEYAYAICQRNNKPLSLHFTTNGYLLSKEMLDELRAYPTSFQITLDGASYVHNSVKATTTDKSTYSRIVENIKLAVEYGCSVNVRLNYTVQTLPTFLDIIADFETLPKAYKRLLTFNFQRVWQDVSDMTSEALADSIRKIERAFVKAGLAVSPSNSNAFHRCYADCDDSMTINYDGNVFKCTARDFTTENSEGVLGQDGVVVWNQHHALRQHVQGVNDICKKCKILPLCHGGCSQYKMDNRHVTDCCLKGYTGEKKEWIIQNRIHDILLVNEYNRNNKE